MGTSRLPPTGMRNLRERALNRTAREAGHGGGEISVSVVLPVSIYINDAVGYGRYCYHSYIPNTK